MKCRKTGSSKQYISGADVGYMSRGTKHSRRQPTDRQRETDRVCVCVSVCVCLSHARGAYVYLIACYKPTPKCLTYAGGQRTRYKDQPRVSLRACDMGRTGNRSYWRDLSYVNAVKQFEKRRIDCAKNRRAALPTAHQQLQLHYICSVVVVTCSSQIVLFGHNRRHR